METTDIGFKRFRNRVILFAASVAIAIDILALIQMGVL